MLSGFVSSRFLVLVLLVVGRVVSLRLVFEDASNLDPKQTAMKNCFEKATPVANEQLESMKTCFDHAKHERDAALIYKFVRPGLVEKRVGNVMKELAGGTFTVQIKSLPFPEAKKADAMPTTRLAGYIIRLAAQQVEGVQFEEAEAYRRFAALCEKYMANEKKLPPRVKPKYLIAPQRPHSDDGSDSSESQ